MPIYEYYCPDNNTIYQFLAKTLAQGLTTPKCPDDGSFRMERLISAFAITGARRKAGKDGASKEERAQGEVVSEGAGGAEATEDPRMEAALGDMEREFSSVDENDPRALARMMRRMSELTGERIDGEMEEVVRKLEEGVDPEKLEEQLGGVETGGEGEEADPYGGPSGEAAPKPEPKEGKHRYRLRRPFPYRDPKLYDYGA